MDSICFDSCHHDFLNPYDMNIQEKRKRLQELLENNIKNEDVGTAIAITGSWGVGKTYFWNKLLEDIRGNDSDNVLSKRKYAYISLFGIESLSDLKTQIYSNIENHHLSIEVPKWLKSLPSIFKDTRITQLGINAPVKLIDNLLFNQVKDAIICFDDFERMSNKLDIKDVMGLANQLKLEKNCQVILILDESKAEGENKSKYAEYKEKLIDDTIMINSVEPLIQEFSQDMDEPLIELMVKFADGLEIHNFRFFQKVIKLYKKFSAELPEVVAESTKEIILIRILQGYFVHDFGAAYEFQWDDVKLVLEENKKDWTKRKVRTYEVLKNISYYFIKIDTWGIEFKKWFDQIDNPDFVSLHKLANSELISEKNQNLKNKIWDIFDRRFNFKVTEKDFEFIAELGAECIKIETIYNVAAAYEFIKKYLKDERKAKKFKQDVCKVIELDIDNFISRRQKEVQLWGAESNIFYEYIDKLAENYKKNRSLKEIVSHYLQYDFFKDEDDKTELQKLSLDEWVEYLTIDIYAEKFILEKDKTLVACLRMLSKVSIVDIFMKPKIVEVLSKIGEESEFKKRYMKDIIENHLD